MTHLQGEEQIMPSARNKTQKEKRRDLFETASMTRNIFEFSNTDSQYVESQNSAYSKEPKIISAPALNNKLGRTATADVTKIELQTDYKKTRSLETGAISKPKDFIFQASSDSDQHPEENSASNEQHLHKTDGKIIFENDDSDEQDETGIQVPPEKPKITVQIFGKKVQIEAEALQDTRTENKVQQRIQQEEKKEPIVKKQLLKALSVMPQNTFAKMKLVRNKNSQGGVAFSVYLEANMRYILSCKKTSSQTYLLSDSIDTFEENDKNYLGKVKTNFFGSQLSFYTRGPNPQKAKQSRQQPRELICTVISHSQQIMQEVKPRDFTVYLLRFNVSYYKDLQGVTKYQTEVPLNQLYDQFESNRDKILRLSNRKSKWSEKQKMHSLNMKGRAKLPSIKNFILEDPTENGRQVMLFGKLDDNQFSFDIHHPLSPTIAMAIALSSFAYKTW